MQYPNKYYAEYKIECSSKGKYFKLYFEQMQVTERWYFWAKDGKIRRKKNGRSYRLYYKRNMLGYMIF